MPLTVPRHEQELPAFHESVVEALNDLPDTLTGRIVTSNNSASTILSIPLLASTVYHLQWVVLARQTAGSGTVGDGAVYVGDVAAALVSGTATIIGSATPAFIREDESGWNAAVAGSGNRLVWSVTGDTGKTISWRIDARIRRLSV